jgi:hypothetical protein
MKLKIILLVAVVAAVGGGITVIVRQSHSRQSLPTVESQLPTVISNYHKTFKLKTSPPIWGEPTSGVTTNANH